MDGCDLGVEHLTVDRKVLSSDPGAPYLHLVFLSFFFLKKCLNFNSSILVDTMINTMAFLEPVSGGDNYNVLRSRLFSLL